MILKIILIVLLFPTFALCGESCVYEIFISSFTDVKLKKTKDGIKLKTKDFNQPLQNVNIIEVSTTSLIIITDVSIRTLENIQTLELDGSIKYIGSFFYDKKGYIRNENFYKIKKYIKDLYKYEVEVSTE